MIRRMFGDYGHHHHLGQNDGHLTPMLPYDDDEFRDHYSSFHDQHSGHHHHRSRRRFRLTIKFDNQMRLFA